MKKNDPKQVIAKLEQYCSPQNNEVLQRYRFWNLPLTSPFDKFATELKAQAEKCNFQEKDKMIRDKVIFTVPKHLKEKLLGEPEITLKKTIDICQAYEQTANNLREMKESETIERVTQGRNLKKKKKHLSKMEELQLQEDMIQDQVQRL